MMHKKKIRFITNPISGTKSKANLEDLLKQHLDHQQYDYEICFTEGPNHATTLSRSAAEEQYYAVVAVGGDGTINEVAKGILHSKTVLGIIPFGSGNGFSYHLGVRRDISRAIIKLNEGHVKFIDTGFANDRFFINVAGIGLDATVAYKTKLNRKRGFLPYFWNTIKEIPHFKFLVFTITANGKTWSDSYAMAVIANGSFYGYDFMIAPNAQWDDGLFEVLLFKKVWVLKYLLLLPRMFNKTIHLSNMVEYFQTAHLTIESHQDGYFHVDGEGFKGVEKFEFKIEKASLGLIC